MTYKEKEYTKYTFVGRKVSNLIFIKLVVLRKSKACIISYEVIIHIERNSIA